jgi:hypothetical protein
MQYVIVDGNGQLYYVIMFRNDPLHYVCPKMDQSLV